MREGGDAQWPVGVVMRLTAAVAVIQVRADLRIANKGVQSMIPTKAVMTGFCAAAVLAGCQQKSSYTPADIAPSPFVQELVDTRGDAVVAEPAPQVASDALSTPQPTYVIESEAYDAAVEPAYVIESTPEPIVESVEIAQPEYVIESATQPSYIVENAPEPIVETYSAVEPTYISEVAPAPVVETASVDLTDYAIDSEAAFDPAPALMIESDVDVLNAPVLDNSAAPVIEQSFSTFAEEVPPAPAARPVAVIEESALPALSAPSGPAAYGEAF